MLEGEQGVVSYYARRSPNCDPVAEQEGMTDNLRLLFQSVTGQRPAWLEAVVIAAKWMPHQN